VLFPNLERVAEQRAISEPTPELPFRAELRHFPEHWPAAKTTGMQNAHNNNIGSGDSQRSNVTYEIRADNLVKVTARTVPAPLLPPAGGSSFFIAKDFPVPGPASTRMRLPPSAAMWKAGVAGSIPSFQGINF
jgi:hypothetical protein